MINIIQPSSEVEGEVAYLCNGFRDGETWCIGGIKLRPEADAILARTVTKLFLETRYDWWHSSCYGQFMYIEDAFLTLRIFNILMPRKDGRQYAGDIVIFQKLLHFDFNFNEPCF